MSFAKAKSDQSPVPEIRSVLSSLICVVSSLICEHCRYSLICMIVMRGGMRLTAGILAAPTLLSCQVGLISTHWGGRLDLLRQRCHIRAEIEIAAMPPLPLLKF